MGVQRENGYSASVEGFLVVSGTKYRLAKTNGVTLVLSEPCVLPPGSEVELVIIVDGNSDSKQIVLPDGVLPGQARIPYQVTVPF
jgi:hypothetical protein